MGSMQCIVLSIFFAVLSATAWSGNKHCADQIGSIAPRISGSGLCTRNALFSVPIPDTGVTVFWNSLDESDTHGLVAGWRLGSERRLILGEVTEGRLWIEDGFGARILFVFNPVKNAYYSPDYRLSRSKIVKRLKDIYEETTASEMVHRYTYSHLTLSSPLNSRDKITYSRHSDRRLSSISMPFGRKIQFFYNSDKSAST